MIINKLLPNPARINATNSFISRQLWANPKVCEQLSWRCCNGLSYWGHKLPWDCGTNADNVGRIIYRELLQDIRIWRIVQHLFPVSLCLVSPTIYVFIVLYINISVFNNSVNYKLRIIWTITIVCFPDAF